MKFLSPEILGDPHYEPVSAAYHMPEAEAVQGLLRLLQISEEAQERIQAHARTLVEQVRRQRLRSGGVDRLMHEYDLSSEEGIALMCLAEALLRIPDAKTADRLIDDKLASGDWEAHLAHEGSWLVHAATWGLMLTGRIIHLKDGHKVLQRIVQRSSEPLIRQALLQAMRLLGEHFVMGRSIEDALARAGSREYAAYCFSFDMLGEAARTQWDADRHFDEYQEALHKLAPEAAESSLFNAPGISVKLSALHPRFEPRQTERIRTELVPRLKRLARKASRANLTLTIDTEEAERLDLTLEVFAQVFADPEIGPWEGLGVALQAYQKRAVFLVDWLASLAQAQGKRIPVRLVKGAYWDAEIKHAQEQGLSDYPVFTRKTTTDLSYLVCAQRLLAAPEQFYPQFATHNAHTLAAVLELAGEHQPLEFQRLHGMGQELYGPLVENGAYGLRCRIYAPVGQHEDLLPYLVRRLLENGSNTSFVNRIADDQAPIEQIIADPVAKTRRLKSIPHPQIPLPRELFGAKRINSKGLDLSDFAQLHSLSQAMEQARRQTWRASPSCRWHRGQNNPGEPVRAPADRQRTVGYVVNASSADIQLSLERAALVAPHWDQTPVEDRASCLERVANLLESHMPQLMTLCVDEAGKTLDDAVAEVREATDFCRYYAAQARAQCAQPTVLPGPTGEHNELRLQGRGVFVCISPWNFPLAIFAGQVAAALAAGNAVLAKPAEQTPLIAAEAVRLFHQAGIPAEVLQLLPGEGEAVGARLVADPRIAGIAFTGSVETAHLINQRLAARPGPIVPLIAETGGQNVMIVDSSALLEQAVSDILASAFHSAGQRCSALRVLYVQQEIAPRLCQMLRGAMAELRVGDPWLLSTDIGPVIDEEALMRLEQHAQRLHTLGKLLYRCELSRDREQGFFFAPCAYEIDDIGLLEREVFGPILHVIRYTSNELDRVIEAINGTGYGLTFGIHSRIDETIDHVTSRVRAGNLYVNRTLVGSVVGVQPFGGEGLSGTGPKAGGPHYLFRFAVERVITINASAAGGNAELLSLADNSP